MNPNGNGDKKQDSTNQHNGKHNGGLANGNGIKVNGDCNRKKQDMIVLGPKNAECISKDGMICCPCSEGIKYSYFAPTQCYVPMEYYVPVQCCVPVECEIRYGAPFIPGKDNPALNCE